MNMEAMLSGRQSNNVDLNEDGFGARRLREGDVYRGLRGRGKGSHDMRH